MTPAVVLACHTIGLSVIRALGSAGVPVHALTYDDMDMGHASKYVSAWRNIHHPERFEEAFLDEILEYGEKCGGAILIPSDDATLTVVSRHRKELKRRYVVACPEWEIVERFVDKRLTYALAEKIGIPCPRTHIPQSRETLSEFARSVGYPCIVKPVHSHRYFELFRKKLVIAESHEEMVEAYREASNAGLDVVIQEYIPGDDCNGVNYNSYVWGGRPYVEFTAEKVRLSPPRWGVPRVVVSKKVDEILENGRSIVAAMGFQGFACTEFKKDARDGVYKLMEVNGRHNRSGMLAVHCGINFPMIEYNHLLNGELPGRQRYPEGIYWIDEFRDIGHSILYLRKERYGVRNYLRPYLSEHVFAVFAWNDPKPFLKRLFDILKRAMSPLDRLRAWIGIRRTNKEEVHAD